MNRREFIAGLGIATVLPLAARAQQEPVLIGILHSGSAEDQASLVAAARDGLRETGFVEGRNLKIEYRWADGHYDRLQQLAAELVAKNVALILAAGGTDPARAAKAATSTIPIVFVSAADPVRTGLVTSLNRPEGNVTGINMLGALLEAKRLELLHEAVPKATAMGVLINPKYPAAQTQVREVQDASSRLRLGLVLRNASTEAELKSAFAGFAQANAGAVLACNDPFFGSWRATLAKLALEHRLPAMSFRREFAEVGGLLSYGAVFEDGYREAGLYSGRILKGARTTDLPVMQPTKFEMVVNLKTAKAIGLALPETFLLRADTVIE
jgi:putative ABC transport system substrate-binding protein